MWTDARRRRAVIVWWPLGGPVGLSTTAHLGGEWDVTGTEINRGAAGVVLPAVPLLDAPAPRGLLPLLMPVVMLAGTVGFLVIGGGGTTSLLMGGLMAVSLVGMIISGGGRHTQPAAAVAADRDRFLRQLERARSEVAARESVIRTAAHRRYPAVGTPRSGASAATDAASPLTVRVGVGTVPAVVPSEVAENGDDHGSAEPFADVALRSFVRAHATTTDMPLTIDLHPGRPWLLVGDRAEDLARSLILQCARVAPPERCAVVLLAPDDAAGWDWLKWLPHHGVVDGSGPLRTSDVAQARRWLRRAQQIGENRAGSTLVVALAQRAVVVDALAAESDDVHPVRVLGLPRSDADRQRGELLLSAEGAGVGRRRHGREVPWGTVEGVGEAAARALARRMLSRIARSDSATDHRSGAPSTTLSDLLLVGAPADYDPALHQEDRSAASRLRVPIGVDATGAAVHLDLKEAARGGMGPHGLLIGATGSGKSELLRTVVLALAATHSTRVLNFVLIDFKGGAGFLPLARLPHVSAVITNLAEQALQVSRMRDALAGELNRRQELLHRAGDVASATDYEAARRRSPELPNCPPCSSSATSSPSCSRNTPTSRRPSSCWGVWVGRWGCTC